MGDNFWSISSCQQNPPVWWYGVPGSGCHYYTDRFGQHFVGGGVYQKYQTIRFECGSYYVPVKDYGWVSEFSAFGQWFYGGAIVAINGVWVCKDGDYGQTAGRLVEDIAPEGVESPWDAPESVVSPRPPVRA